MDTNLFAEEISAGRLVKPFEATLDDGYGYYLINASGRPGDTAIALFRSWLIERFGSAQRHGGSRRCSCGVATNERRRV